MPANTPLPAHLPLPVHFPAFLPWHLPTAGLPMSPLASLRLLISSVLTFLWQPYPLALSYPAACPLPLTISLDCPCPFLLIPSIRPAPAHLLVTLGIPCR